MGVSLPLSDQNQKVLITGVSSRLVYGACAVSAKTICHFVLPSLTEGSPCDAFPCWNGGTCFGIRHALGRRKWRRRGMANNNSKAYTCKCRPQFGGEHCESRKAEQENSTGADWCSTERQTCPVGMICVISNSADRQCVSIRALSASPTEHLFPLPPLLLTFYGLFLFILLLLFCWAGNSSGFFLLLRKRDKRGQWKEPTLTDQRKGEYEPILGEEGEAEGQEVPVELGGSDAIEMGRIRRKKWGHRLSTWEKKNDIDHWHGRTLFSVGGIRTKALESEGNSAPMPDIVHI